MLTVLIPNKGIALDGPQVFDQGIDLFAIRCRILVCNPFLGRCAGTCDKVKSTTRDVAYVRWTGTVLQNATA